MKKITTKQLAEILELKTPNIYVYERRKKIRFIRAKTGITIDVEDPVNEKFIKEFTQKKGKVIRAIDIIPYPTKYKKKNKSNEALSRRKNTSNDVSKPISELELHRTEKMKHDAELSRIRFEREAGRILPKDLAEQVFNSHFTNASREFYNGADNYTIIINEKLGGTKEDLAFFRSKLVEIIDDSINTALENTMKDIAKICLEYSKNDKND